MAALLAGAQALAFGALAVSMVLVFVRLVRGPTRSDRVVALDTFAYLAVGFLAVHTLATGDTAYLDAALLLALFAFLGTLAFAAHVERSRPEEDA
jgi:multicomponent Na+:H+ antiporter subunit F